MLENKALILGPSPRSSIAFCLLFLWRVTDSEAGCNPFALASYLFNFKFNFAFFFFLKKTNKNQPSFYSCRAVPCGRLALQL